MNSKRFNISLNSITTGAVVAGFYTAICLVFPLISYGALQIRIAEALTILSVFSPIMGVGVTLGCAISNAIGFAMGTNPLVLDIILGTLATGIAAYLSWKLRNIKIRKYPIASVFPPIIINAIIIGAEITFLETNALFKFPSVLFLNSLYIGLGQLIPCLILGPALVIFLQNIGFANMFIKNKGR